MKATLELLSDETETRYWFKLSDNSGTVQIVFTDGKFNYSNFYDNSGVPYCDCDYDQDFTREKIKRIHKLINAKVKEIELDNSFENVKVTV